MIEELICKRELINII